MLVVTRHRIDPAGAEAFLARAEPALAALAAQPGCLGITVGRATDDAGLVAVVSTWESVGGYRRALGAYEVKLHAIPLLATAIDEPSAYEEVLADGPGGARRWEPDRAPDADTVDLPRGSGR